MKSNAIEPLEDIREFAGTEWASVPVAVTQDGTATGQPARWIKCVSVGGTAVLETENMPAGTTTRSITMAVGDVIPLRVRRIVNGTFAGKIQVGW
jgi:hypothetical protein